MLRRRRWYCARTSRVQPPPESGIAPYSIARQTDWSKTMKSAMLCRLGNVLIALALAGPLAAQSLPLGNPATLGFSPARLARIDRVMQQAVDSGRVAGVVTLIARHGKLAYLRAFGSADREAGRRMTTDALFRIASQTKAITSVAVMMLVEEGRLGLNDPVSRYLPSFAGSTVATKTDTGVVILPAAQPITIRDLLTHTAGISYGTDALIAEQYRAAGLGPAAGWGWYTADKDEPICVTMDRLGTLPKAAQPRRGFVYGYNTDILGCVVERISGEPLDHFFRSRIFAPLGMRDTDFFPPANAANRLAAVYAMTEGLVRAPDGPMGQGDYLVGPRRSFAGGAGLVSTAADYARFLQMLLNGGILDGARILSPMTVSLMTTDQIDSLYGGKGSGFGLGFSVLESPGLAGQYGSVGRYGWGGAYGTTYWVDPAQDLVAVFMMQLLPRGNVDIADRFQALVYQAIVGSGRAAP
jgi:CubicO group peptidase (beta-lactamase class C family)